MRKPQCQRGSVEMNDRSIIQLEGVTVDYDGFKALNNLNFIVDYNELRVVIGPNGAGKTTLLDVICGKTKPANGRVFFGKDVNLIGKREDEIAALGIGRKFQAPSVYGNLTVWENDGSGTGTDRAEPRNDWPKRVCTHQSRVAVARSEAMARNRHGDFARS